MASVLENEPITASKLASAETGAGLSPAIPQGMRAISVKVNDVIGVAGFIVPGSRVDVVVTIRRPNDSMTNTVASNVQVLTAGTRKDQESPGPSTEVGKHQRHGRHADGDTTRTPSSSRWRSPKGRSCWSFVTPRSPSTTWRRAIKTDAWACPAGRAAPRSPGAGAPSLPRLPSQPPRPHAATAPNGRDHQGREEHGRGAQGARCNEVRKEPNKG